MRVTTLAVIITAAILQAVLSATPGNIEIVTCIQQNCVIKNGVPVDEEGCVLKCLHGGPSITQTAEITQDINFGMATKLASCLMGCMVDKLSDADNSTCVYACLEMIQTMFVPPSESVTDSETQTNKRDIKSEEGVNASLLPTHASRTTSVQTAHVNSTSADADAVVSADAVISAKTLASSSSSKNVDYLFSDADITASANLQTLLVIMVLTCALVGLV
ncbi:hypothetical protein AX774_g405 [Zancudomyces culisetae]|uniref:Uncharacterized protein n=1 Tax=Zancudomyces culisetae TaxID=1213189 RepID=A0A1R1PYL2_ZANCU|nr:hypothetical protein AX774_g405 [Zancudomyces culisetae]|eukprot:OMH86024.1 hypothetical protein AX774_g405 [Zancudomyces culisetae]